MFNRFLNGWLRLQKLYGEQHIETVAFVAFVPVRFCRHILIYHIVSSVILNSNRQHTRRDQRHHALVLVQPVIFRVPAKKELQGTFDAVQLHVRVLRQLHSVPFAEVYCGNVLRLGHTEQSVHVHMSARFRFAKERTVFRPYVCFVDCKVSCQVHIISTVFRSTSSLPSSRISAQCMPYAMLWLRASGYPVSVCYGFPVRICLYWPDASACFFLLPQR